MKFSEMSPEEFFKNVPAENLKYFLLKPIHKCLVNGKKVPKHQKVNFPCVQLDMQNITTIQNFRYCLN